MKPRWSVIILTTALLLVPGITRLLEGAGDPSTVVQTPSVPAADDRCPVCGMLVAPFPGWIAQLRLSDGTTLFFDGPKDMFKYMHDPSRYGGGSGEVTIAGGFVTSYYDQTDVAIEDAAFVVGSDVTGPMGAELVPHRNLEEAREFVLDHGGTRILMADEVTPDVIADLH